MTTILMVEGATEKAFVPFLREYLAQRVERQPKILPRPEDGFLPQGAELRKKVRLHLKEADAVIALTDVYTGGNDFVDASDAKRKMRDWVGADETRFYPHAALHEFEAWLLPYWERIQQLARHKKQAPGANPEAVNHGKPPSRHLDELFRVGLRKRYSKRVDAARILKGQDLDVAVRACPELSAFIQTIISLCDKR